ncbi:DNA cytosine methyltransferase [Paroceanicella profunda]|uniref:DNA (cytosine-5-)-methyltransferase n=1 Tax=Paroceanicella profunda TaxID=2579971 RepID=A0A5B8G0D2_9RHOB|nr:DNA cytosine methyltransferase [Paroceanicella profunda]QDL92519.1 DNA cytosine methyltransferase [Paroceanicella profunda]
MNALLPFAPLPAEPVDDRELITDSFAGGGGASTGIEMALGRSPDYAIDHDAEALALHAANHPDTVHVSKNIWQVDPLELIGRRPVGLSWSSPDCKHFSKAKGGRPLKRNIRDLAWTVVLWAKRVRPRVIILENVEEFRTWGPLTVDGKPCPQRRGETFARWVRELQRLGYKVEHRELRACDYGAPTIRKRLFVIARRDGKPIVWPEPTHGAPDSAEVKAGKLKPWRTAAEIIDWSLPCPSIFDTSEEIMAKHGLRAVRPLAEATMRRIARGVMRYVLEAERPFLISVAHGYSGGRREYSVDEPVGVQTAGAGSHAVVVPSLAPFVSYAQHGGANRSAGEPLHTITASPKDQNCVVAPTLVQTGYGERKGQAPRALDIEAPLGTQVAGACKHALVAAFLTKFNTGSTGAPLSDPAPTITANSFIKRPGGAAPIGIAMAFLAQHNGGVVGRRADAPLSTLTTAGSHQQLVAASLASLRGTGTAHPVDEPLRTLTAGGQHAGLISAFLTKYYGTGGGAELAGPMHTDTTKDRFGLVTVEIDVNPYAIADIGMRMLTPRERFRAQGFPDSYEIDTGVLPDGSTIKLTGTAQGRMCGNSVCPPLAAALARANVPELAMAEAAA